MILSDEKEEKKKPIETTIAERVLYGFAGMGAVVVAIAAMGGLTGLVLVGFGAGLVVAFAPELTNWARKEMQKSKEPKEPEKEE